MLECRGNLADAQPRKTASVELPDAYFAQYDLLVTLYAAWVYLKTDPAFCSIANGNIN